MVNPPCGLAKKHRSIEAKNKKTKKQEIKETTMKWQKKQLTYKGQYEASLPKEVGRVNGPNERKHSVKVTLQKKWEHIVPLFY